MYPQSEFSLRQWKYARTKLALRNAVLERLKEKSLEEITVRELCAATEVSEATFFNYFPGKTNLLAYCVQLWTLEAGWHARHALETGSGLRAIEALFEFTARWWADNPEVMAEFVAWQACRRGELPLSGITAVERANAFPELDGIEDLPVEGIDAILPALIANAIKRGELPADTDISKVTTFLLAILFGVPIAQRNMKGTSVGELYRSQLQLFRAGLNVQKGERLATHSRSEASDAFPWR